MPTEGRIATVGKITPDFPVRPSGAVYQWRTVPPSMVSGTLVADERLGWATGRAEASRQRWLRAIEQFGKSYE